MTSTLSSLVSAVQALKAASEGDGAGRHSQSHGGRRRSREQGSCGADGDSIEPSFGRGSAAPPVHALALTSPYPGSGGVARASLRPDQVPWDAEVPGGYSPPELDGGDDADRDPDDPAGLEFNAYDKARQLERRSHTGAYRLLLQRPVNPVGRTGLSGRGALPAWGPNHLALLAITRWSRDESAGGGRVRERRGKRVLELLALPGGGGDYRLPELPARGLPLGGDCRQLLGAPGNQSVLAVAKEAEQLLAPVVDAAGAGFASGYLDDERSTDNAWMEQRAFSLHDEQGGLWDAAKIKLNSPSRPRWTELSHKSEGKFPRGHWQCLEKLIQMRNAYY